MWLASGWLLLAASGCGNSEDGGRQGASGTGGAVEATGGAASGGSGLAQATGGATSATGGASPGGGGNATGGALLGGGGTGTGGAPLGDGGAATGGALPGGGGTATGGIDPGTGGASTGGAGAGAPGTSGAGPGGAGGTAGAQIIDPTCPDAIDLGVHLVGRYDACNDTGVRMSWSGTGFVARFLGTGLEVSFEGSGSQYTVVVDGAVEDTLVTDGGGTYTLASGLAAGEHQVELYRRVEPNQGAATLVDVAVVGGDLLPAPPRPSRLIEIIGDSITCGYGNEGPNTSCGFTPDTENHYLTYGALLAREFGAELSTVAWSGKGVVSNYNGDLVDPLPALYERAEPNDASSEWHFGWQPNLVIINLSTNDYSTNQDPTDVNFTTGYEELLTTIRGHYPDAYILCTVGPMLGGSDLATAQTNIAAAVSSRQNAGDDRVNVYDMTTGNPDPACDWHPNLVTHAAMADELSAVIAPMLGW